MKSSFVTFILGCILSLASLNVYSQTSDLIISEYGEGSSSNKYIEIYNGTGIDVDLTPYHLNVASNGNPWGSPIDLTGTLTNGDVYIICHTSADASIQGIADIITGSLDFNGNDAVGLFTTASIIDMIGQVGFNPGTGWTVAGTTNATQDHTLVRKATVCSPNNNWATSAGTSAADSEWIVNPQDDWSNLGSHTSACGGVQVPLNAIWIIMLFAGTFLFIKRYIR